MLSGVLRQLQDALGLEVRGAVWVLQEVVLGKHLLILLAVERVTVLVVGAVPGGAHWIREIPPAAYCSALDGCKSAIPLP
eukprot:4868752-Heterocapsa_arctica.AAC.1